MVAFVSGACSVTATEGANVPPLGMMTGGARAGVPGRLFIQARHYRDGVGVNQVARERRHLDGRVNTVHPVIKNGTPDILRRDNVGVVVTQVANHGGIDDVLIGQRRVVASVEGGASPAWLMALGAIGVQVGAGALFE